KTGLSLPDAPAATDGSLDSDGDGLPNGVEVAIGTDPASTQTGGLGDATADTDGDGLANATEIVLGLDPGKADTDGNGVPAARERARAHAATGRGAAGAAGAPGALSPPPPLRIGRSDDLPPGDHQRFRHVQPRRLRVGGPARRVDAVRHGARQHRAPVGARRRARLSPPGGTPAAVVAGHPPG